MAKKKNNNNTALLIGGLGAAGLLWWSMRGKSTSSASSLLKSGAGQGIKPVIPARIPVAPSQNFALENAGKQLVRPAYQKKSTVQPKPLVKAVLPKKKLPIADPTPLEKYSVFPTVVGKNLPLNLNTRPTLIKPNTLKRQGGGSAVRIEKPRGGYGEIQSVIR